MYKSIFKKILAPQDDSLGLGMSLSLGVSLGLGVKFFL